MAQPAEMRRCQRGWRYPEGRGAAHLGLAQLLLQLRMQSRRLGRHLQRLPVHIARGVLSDKKHSPNAVAKCTAGMSRVAASCKGFWIGEPRRQCQAALVKRSNLGNTISECTAAACSFVPRGAWGT